MIAELVEHARRRVERFVGRERPIILMYHHLADISVDPWKLAVTPERFSEQIEALCQVRRVVALDELSNVEAARRHDKPLAAITFDDGYLSVATSGRTVLERHDCAATVFLATGAIGSPREFWWDDLTRILLESRLPNALELVINGQNYAWSIGPNPKGSQLERLHQTIWNVLLPLDEEIRERALDELAAAVGIDLRPRLTHRIMTEKDVHDLEGGPIIVGAHCVTHPFLPTLDAASQEAEIFESRRACEMLTGRAPSSFAYPFGSYGAATPEIVRRAGFSSAVTTNPGVVRPVTDPMLLPRIAIENWDGESFLRSLW